MNPIKLDIPSGHNCSLLAVRYRGMEPEPMRADSNVASVAQTNLPRLSTLHSEQAHQPSLAELREVWETKKLYAEGRYREVFHQLTSFLSRRSNSPFVAEFAEMRINAAIPLMEVASACYQKGEFQEAQAICQEIGQVLQHDLSFQNLQKQIVYAKWREGFISQAMNKGLCILAAQFNSDFLKEFPSMRSAQDYQMQIDLIMSLDTHSMFNGRSLVYFPAILPDDTFDSTLHFAAVKALSRGDFSTASRYFEDLSKSEQENNRIKQEDYRHLTRVCSELDDSLNSMDRLMKEGNNEGVSSIQDQFFKKVDQAMRYADKLNLCLKVRLGIF